MPQLPVFSGAALAVPTPMLPSPRAAGAAETLHMLFFLLLTLLDWSLSHSLPHLMKIDLFCFLLCFSPQRFFTAMLAVSPLAVSPSHKRKGHTQPGLRQEAKVDTNVIETGYWYSPCRLPAHLGKELFLLCILSVEVFSSLGGCSVHSCFSLCEPENCLGPLSLPIFMLSQFSHEWFTAYLSKWHLNAKSGPVGLLKLLSLLEILIPTIDWFTFSWLYASPQNRKYSPSPNSLQYGRQHRVICGLI